MSKAEDERLLRKAIEFDRIAKDVLEKRVRERRNISEMHDVAKRSMDEAAKRLGK